MAPGITGHPQGFIRVGAVSLDDARTLLIGNPVFEAGGTVGILELPRTGRPIVAGWRILGSH